MVVAGMHCQHAMLDMLCSVPLLERARFGGKAGTALQRSKPSVLGADCLLYDVGFALMKAQIQLLASDCAQVITIEGDILVRMPKACICSLIAVLLFFEELLALTQRS